MDKFCIGYRVVIAFLQQKSNQRSEKTYFSLLWPFRGRSGSRKVKNPLNFDLSLKCHFPTDFWVM